MKNGLLWFILGAGIALGVNESFKSSADSAQPLWGNESDYLAEIGLLKAQIAKYKNEVTHRSELPESSNAIRRTPLEQESEEKVSLVTGRQYDDLFEEYEWLEGEHQALKNAYDLLSDEVDFLRKANVRDSLVRFHETEYFRSLSSGEQKLVDDLFEKTGTELAQWQVEELVSFIPGNRAEYWRLRAKATEEYAKTGSWQDPVVRSMREEAMTLSEDYRDKIFSVLGDELAHNYLPQ